jgi:hypothetical protein
MELLNQMVLEVEELVEQVLHLMLGALVYQRFLEIPIFPHLLEHQDQHQVVGLLVEEVPETQLVPMRAELGVEERVDIPLF